MDLQTCVFLFIEDADDVAGKYKSQGLRTNKQSNRLSRIQIYFFKWVFVNFCIWMYHRNLKLKYEVFILKLR